MRCKPMTLVVTNEIRSEGYLPSIKLLLSNFLKSVRDDDDEHFIWLKLIFFRKLFSVQPSMSPSVCPSVYVFFLIVHLVFLSLSSVDFNVYFVLFFLLLIFDAIFRELKFTSLGKFKRYTLCCCCFWFILCKKCC